MLNVRVMRERYGKCYRRLLWTSFTPPRPWCSRGYRLIVAPGWVAISWSWPWHCAKRRNRMLITSVSWKNWRWHFQPSVDVVGTSCHFEVERSLALLCIESWLHASKFGNRHFKEGYYIIHEVEIPHQGDDTFVNKILREDIATQVDRSREGRPVQLHVVLILRG